ncbi:MAG: serine protease [Thermomicrobiales bacterium]
MAKRVWTVGNGPAWPGLVKPALAILLVIGVLISRDASAFQIAPDVRDRVIPAAVQLMIFVEVQMDGDEGILPFVTGSGTVVSPDGLILTNWHVVDMEAHQQSLDDLVAQNSAEGIEAEIDLLDEGIAVAVSSGEGLPEIKYLAVVVAGDPELDLAVLQVLDDLDSPDDSEANHLNYLPLGDSDVVQIGDALDVFGYPGNADGF